MGFVVLLIAVAVGTMGVNGCREGSRGKVAYLAASGGYWQVWTMAPEGDNARQVTTSSYEKARVSWFPDGRSLLVNALDGRIFKVDAESGEEVEIRVALGAAQDAVISSDGKRIAFSADTTGSKDKNAIWVAAADGTGLRQVVEMAGLQHEPHWSRDDDWIYFLSGEGKQNHDIWRVSTETGAREQLTAGQLYHFDLALSPDDVLAFSGNRSGNYEIWIWDQTGEEAPRRVTDDPGLDGGPAWSPDGRSLIFHSSRSGSLNLWAVPAEGGEARQLTHHPEGARGAAWWHPLEAGQ